MSSVGPSIAIVTGRSVEETGEFLRSIGLEMAITTRVDNHGIRISHAPG